MREEQVKDLLPAYALGVVSPAEAGRVREFLATNLANRKEMSAWKDLVAELAFAAEPQDPPAQLCAQLLEKVRQLTARESFPSARHASGSSNIVAMPPRKTLREVPPITIKPAVSKWWLALAAAVAALALLGALFIVWRKNQSLQGENRELARQLQLSDQALTEERALRQTLVGPDGRGIFLQGTNAAPRAHANLAYNIKSGAASLAIKDLPPAQNGKSYQIWFIKGSQIIPGTTFNTDTQGAANISLQIPDNGLHAETFAVTLEPQYGATAPTGEKYLTKAVS